MDLVVPGNGILLWQLTGLSYLGFWIYALIHMIRSDFKDSHTKLIWAILIVFVPIIGTFLYLSMNKRTKKRDGRFDPDFTKNSTS
ncbi:MAG: PLD nuclease N-terminal domain-containing protein [Algoriphagus sp.]|nr:PLD nuclease N-terminal domain-containing protein [Algoriphagus sp.]